MTDIMVLRDALAALSRLIKTISKTHRKRGTKSVTLCSMADESALKDLVGALSPAKLGFLIAAIANLTEINQDLANLMGSEPAQLDRLGGRLDGVVANLDKALRGP